jgi:hypothetical protein
MTFFFDGDAEPTPPEGLVTVGRFDDPVEAQMARGMLEAAGVETFMVGENLNNLMPGAFRCRVQVRVEDEVGARELLSSGDDEDEDGL